MSVELYSLGVVNAPAETKPRLSLIQGEGIREPVSRELFLEYSGLRIAAGMISKPEGNELTSIQESVRGWLNESHPDKDAPGTVGDYRTYDIGVIEKKIGGLVDFLKENHSNKVSELELKATETFIASTFAMYEDKNKPEVLSDRDGSFAFIVPARMSRKYPIYGQEVEPVIPALRYVPNELRAWIMRGCPPFIIDTYKPDDTGRRGYLVYAPVTEDMQGDLAAESLGTFMKASQEAVSDAVDFATDRLGVRVVGLGATLPKITNHGKSIKRDDVVTTTGHGGTAWLITETINKNRQPNQERVGVIGLGYIGAAAAGIAADLYNRPITIYDTVESKAHKIASQHPGQFNVAPDARTLIRESDIIISAVTTALSMNRLGVREMDGKLVVDDSQPASFNPEEVEALGGNVLWVIGRDNTGDVQRSGYSYGTMYDEQRDLFGCEAEAATLAKHWKNLEARGVSPAGARRIIGELALNGPVTVESASNIGRLFAMYGIGTGESQAFGRLVNMQNSKKHKH